MRYPGGRDELPRWLLHLYAWDFKNYAPEPRTAQAAGLSVWVARMTYELDYTVRDTRGAELASGSRIGERADIHRAIEELTADLCGRADEAHARFAEVTASFTVRTQAVT